MSPLASASLRPATTSRGALRPTVPVLRSAVPVARPVIPVARPAIPVVRPATSGALSQNLPAVGAAPRALRTPVLMKEGQS